MLRLLAPAVAAAALLATPAAAAPTFEPSKIVAKLNAERARLGMAPVTHEPSWSQKCGLHNRWMKLNGRVQHPEIPGTKGASADGHWAGTHAVLSSGWAWNHANPWINAPIHLSQVYHPMLRVVGASDAHRHSCMTTWPGVQHEVAVVALGAPQADHVFTSPADGGKVPYAQNASESPFTPQEKVGIRAGRVTGPYLYVWSYSDIYDESAAHPEWDPVKEEFVEAPWLAAAKAPVARLVSGQLLGPGGRPVRTKLIDNEAVEGYVGDGNGWLLPVRPLKPNRSYRATVVLATSEETEPERQRTITHTWMFTTTRKALGYVKPLRRRR